MKDFDYWLQRGASENMFGSWEGDCDDLDEDIDIDDPSDEDLLALEEEILNKVL